MNELNLVLKSASHQYIVTRAAFTELTKMILKGTCHNEIRKDWKISIRNL